MDVGESILLEIASGRANSKQSTSKKRTKTTWPHDDTIRLIEIMKSTSVQRKLEGMVHNHKVWKDVATELDNVYPAEKCHDKWSYLKRRYREVRRNNNSSGRGRQSFMFYEEMDSILGHRPMSGVANHAHLDSSSLVTSADTEVSSDHNDDDEDVPDEDDTLSQNSHQTSNSPEDLDENDVDTSIEEPSTSKEPSKKRNNTKGPNKRNQSMAKVVQSAMATLVQLQDKIDKREDKRCKIAEEKEEQKLKEEREVAENQRRWEYEQQERRIKEHREFMLQMVQILRQPSYPPNYPNQGNGWGGPGPSYTPL